MKVKLRVHTSLLFLLLFLLSFAPGCEWDEHKTSGPSDPTPTPTTDQRLFGTWYTSTRTSVIQSEGYQIETDGTMHRLVVDGQGKLQYDSTSGPGQLTITQPGKCTFTFPNSNSGVTSTQPADESYSYYFMQNDSTLALYQHYDDEADYVRTNIGDVVR